MQIGPNQGPGAKQTRLPASGQPDVPPTADTAPAEAMFEEDRLSRSGEIPNGPGTPLTMASLLADYPIDAAGSHDRLITEMMPEGGTPIRPVPDPTTRPITEMMPEGGTPIRPVTGPITEMDPEGGMPIQPVLVTEMMPEGGTPLHSETSPQAEEFKRF